MLCNYLFLHVCRDEKSKPAAEVDRLVLPLLLAEDDSELEALLLPDTLRLLLALLLNEPDAEVESEADSDDEALLLREANYYCILYHCFLSPLSILSLTGCLPAFAIHAC
jgi:hypothetical protein